MVTAEIITIGNELLSGQTIDTNSAWLAEQLSFSGFKTVYKTSVGDNESDILAALAMAEHRVSLTLITGGLGPTNDDLTKPCLAKYFQCDLVLNLEALEEVTQFFRLRNRELSPMNRKQAELPACCEKITNAIGTAPGMWFERNGKIMVSMPGIPRETKLMMRDRVLPKLIRYFRPPAIIHKNILTIGLGESYIAELLKDWEAALPPHIQLAYLPGVGSVKLRLTGSGDSAATLEQELQTLIQKIQPILGNKYIYGYGEDTIAGVIGKLLSEKNLTMAVAESCTGGYISHLITSMPGSSQYYLGSMIPYAYDIKKTQLGVKPETLEAHGAVSEPTIIEMANVVRARFNSDIGLATSGIAGPGGATPEKPVGLVWIAYSDKKHTVTQKLFLGSERLSNIEGASLATLNLLRKNLLEL